MAACVCILSCVQISVTPWTVAARLLCPYWSELTFATPGELHNPCIKAASLVFPASSSGFSTTMPPGNPFLWLPLLLKCICVDHE